MFELDARLQQDTCWLADLPLCRVLLMNDARYPWLILVPRVADVSEVFELDESQQQQLWNETRLLAQAMQQVFAADKMNIGALGNVVRQLHMHVVVRMDGDDSWPAPVWGRGVAQPYSETEQDAVRREMLRALYASGLQVQSA